MISLMDGNDMEIVIVKEPDTPITSNQVFYEIVLKVPGDAPFCR